jgi:hypothetical protein
MKTINDLSYKEWQKRNTTFLSLLNANEKKDLRQRGYKNVGWQNVMETWKIIQVFIKVTPMIEKRIKKGDIMGILRHVLLDVDNGIEYAEDSIQYAEDSLQDIANVFDRAKKISQHALSKYKNL